MLSNESKLDSYILNNGVDIEDYDLIRTDCSRMRGFDCHKDHGNSKWKIFQKKVWKFYIWK